MAVIVVGDLDPDEIERLIRQRFGADAGGARRRGTAFPIPPHRDTRFVTVSDREAQGTSVSVIFKGPFHALETLEDYRRSLVESLAFQMINARFAEIARRPDAPFLAASAGSRHLRRQRRRRASFGARVKDGETERGPHGARRRRSRASASSDSARPSSIARGAARWRSTSGSTTSATTPRAIRWRRSCCGTI